MAEITDRLPGEIILASYSNDIRDRSLQRYADRTARDVSNPIPATGDMAWISSLGVLEVFDSVAWRVYTDDEQLEAVDLRLKELEDQVYSSYQEINTKTFGTSATKIDEITIPNDGPWVVWFYGVIKYTNAVDITADSPLTAAWRVNDLLDIHISDLGSSSAGKQATPFAHSAPFTGLNAGAKISMYLNRISASTSGAEATDFWMHAQRVAVGILPARDT